MERSSKTTTAKPMTARHSRTCRSGKITIVTMFAILGLIVLAGFIGNAGHVVTNKIVAQNAADSVAFSSAQWMARGMNAVTATNHLLGEATGIVVVLEGLGGPEADEGMEDYPATCSITDSVNRTLANMAIIKGNPIYGTEAAAQLDRPLVNSVVKEIVSTDKDRKNHHAFATIFDAKLVLKKATTKRLWAKFFANWLFLVPPPWGYLSAIAAYATHAIADEQLIEIGIEYVYLHVLEKLITSGKILKKVKVDVLEDMVIPALAAHGDYLAGSPSDKVKDKPKTEAGVVNHAVRDTLEHLGEVYHVKAVVYPTASTFPGLVNLRLPIEAEAPPTNKGTREDKYEKEWGNDDLKFEDPDDQLDKVFKDMKEKKEKIQERLRELQGQLTKLTELKEEVEDLEKRTGVSKDELAEFGKEKQKILDDMEKKRTKIQKYNKDLEELAKQEKAMLDAMASMAKAPDGSGNISKSRDHLGLDKMNQADERTTQWVRATYPYVDAFRAPLLRLFHDHMDRSDAAEHFKKWTDRYTLVKSWKFRSGYRFKADAGAKPKHGTWKKDPKTKLLTMYLMAREFNPDKPLPPPKAGEKRIAKGQEIWTKDTEQGKAMAEEMFTVIGMTHRELKPLFSPVIYPIASRFGVTTFAQAVYYNANEQAPPEPNAKPTMIQSRVAWDTLAWAPTASPPEWGATPATESAESIWPWEIFTPDEKLLGNAAAKLNWQAKLMPVTKTRLKQAIPAGAAALDLEMSENVGAAWILDDKFDMVTH